MDNNQSFKQMRSRARLLLKKLGVEEGQLKAWERHIHKTVPTEEAYQACIYEAIGILRHNPQASPQNLADPWVMFPDLREKEDQRQNLLQNPFQVVEGIIECRKCHSKKTLSHQVQRRSGDEGMTTEVLCTNCGFKFSL